ncbi:hypothetical protein ACLOJK_040132 [Asimina triloba]
MYLARPKGATLVGPALAPAPNSSLLSCDPVFLALPPPLAISQSPTIIPSPPSPSSPASHRPIARARSSLASGLPLPDLPPPPPSFQSVADKGRRFVSVSHSPSATLHPSSPHRHFVSVVFLHLHWSASLPPRDPSFITLSTSFFPTGVVFSAQIKVVTAIFPALHLLPKPPSTSSICSDLLPYPDLHPLQYAAALPKSASLPRPASSSIRCCPA